ncbi:MAG: glutamine--fructose-6-phosphate transaminase (isomerizing) [Nitrospirae bacterium]|nr:MAG: glutamine--fructose-6-phosphate transaminase (isomerizing) [Nitrospirota bacterium]
MCGIIGYTGRGNAVRLVVEGLKHLEYRGYDSAGIAYLKGEDLIIKKCKGKIRDLEKLLDEPTTDCTLAIGHTRWATHGLPTDYNAHPHCSDNVVVVHNGIIENYRQLKGQLEKRGYVFQSETDTEVLSHLIDLYHQEAPLEEAVTKALKEVRGSYAVLVISKKERSKLIGARKDSPLVFGISEDGHFIASDVPAFLRSTNRVVFLEDGEMVVVKDGDYSFIGLDGIELKKETVTLNWSPAMAEKGGYRHFMIKEIHEQPRAVSDTLSGRLLLREGRVNPHEFGLSTDYLKGLSRIYISACGTSWHAALIGKYLIESLSGVNVEVDLASEFRYRNPLIKKDDLFIAITQSGETADTLAAQREAKRRGARTLSICNVLGATSAREADAVFYTHSGPEIGVASTKAFTAQLVALQLFAMLLEEVKKEEVDHSAMIDELLGLPEKMEDILRREEEIEEIARQFSKAKDFLYLGRGLLYPIALEGALKLKEISYIHAEGYPAGEMKHGPIALIDEEMPVVVLVQKGPLKEKVLSNIEEVKARGGRTIVFTSVQDRSLSESDWVFRVPETAEELEPLLMVVPLQLLAYHIGVLRGYDVDQPRNLAKSVTVE